MKKFFATFLCLVCAGASSPPRRGRRRSTPRPFLLMEKTTGQVLYEETPTIPWSWPASPR